MIAIDANVFLRLLSQPATEQDTVWAAEARTLFRAIEARSVDARTNEAVVAEVVFILSAARHYAVDRTTVADWIGRLLRLPSLGLPTKAACLDALDLWARHPVLDFPDALVIVQARTGGGAVATFDRDVRRLAAVPLWTPADANGTGSS